MSKIHLVVPDPHAVPGVSNERAEWLGRLINDVKPDTVVVLGDTADMPSLCSYDKGTRSFQGRSYAQDIAAHGDFQERLWDTVRRSKRKLPRRVTLIGNHEQRIARAIDLQPELEGTISYRDLALERWYDDIVDYVGSTPGTIDVDGITYAHYLISGVSGRPISSEHQAHTILQKQFKSSTVGHLHTFDFCVKTTGDRRKIYGLCAGVFQEHEPNFAGDANRLWWRGVLIKRGVSNGMYDLEQVSLERLKREYKG